MHSCRHLTNYLSLHIDAHLIIDNFNFPRQQDVVSSWSTLVIYLPPEFLVRSSRAGHDNNIEFPSQCDSFNPAIQALILSFLHSTPVLPPISSFLINTALYPTINV
jgi:hypothetical protein